LQERVRTWTSGLAKEQRSIERDMKKIERDEAKVKLELKKAAAAGQKQACVTYAKTLVKSQKVRNRLMETKTRIGSVITTIKVNHAQVKVAGALQQSARIMQGMSQLMNMPAIAKTAKSMAMEMQKAGFIEEMVEDAMSATEDADIDEKADEEVDKVLFEITAGQLGKMPNLKDRPKQADKVEEPAVVDDSKEDAELEAMKAKLEQL